MSRIDDYLFAAFRALRQKPDDGAKQPEKKAYSEAMSARIAVALASELRARGMTETRPAEPGELGLSGAERRLAGGIGAKKVDVTWTTEESGLLLGISVKTINFRDRRTGNFQKNLTNRRGDMLAEALTLHRRFPYAVVAGFLFLDMGAKADQTAKRKSTFENALPRLRLFTGRQDPAGRDEQYERLYIVLVDANQFRPVFECYHVSDAREAIPLSDVMDDLVGLVAERNFDFYEANDGRVDRV